MSPQLLLLPLLLSLCLARPQFKALIPNGEAWARMNSGITCEALGHNQCIPGAPRNPFGLDFMAAGFRWTQELCETDSDGDGVTNGQELGDPCCTWTAENPTPLRLTQLSHPGVFEEDGARAAPGCEVATQAPTTTVAVEEPVVVEPVVVEPVVVEPVVVEPVEEAAVEEEVTGEEGNGEVMETEEASTGTPTPMTEEPVLTTTPTPASTVQPGPEPFSTPPPEPVAPPAPAPAPITGLGPIEFSGPDLESISFPGISGRDKGVEESMEPDVEAEASPER